LLELATWGAPIVPTVALLQGSAAALDGICDAQGWNAVVVKPAVGVGAHGAGRFDVGDPSGGAHLDELLSKGDVLVQPYVSSIALDGEVSVVLVEGRMTHCVRKTAAPGDYRIQEHWGGTTEPIEPAAGFVQLAERVCASLPWPTLYARVDLVVIDGAWHVLELEVTEPSLWLDLAPDGVAERLAAAVLARCG
jgi:glutathione synthase/RimK-type ligase-like ATP-grasp enzyme